MQQLLELEEKIEDVYLQLMTLDIDGFEASLNYQILKEELRRLVQLEVQLLIRKDFSCLDLRKVLKEFQVKPTLPVRLGCYEHAYSFRLDALLDTISGDATIEYADALNYDIHRIILKCLETVINNDYYQNIRGDLLRFKYDLIFLDYGIESDFLLDNDKESIILRSRTLKEDLPSSKYVDQTILVSEFLEDIRYLRVLSQEFSEDYLALAIIYVLRILARVAMCDDEILAYVMNDFNLLLEDEELNIEVKNVIVEMLEIFKQLQHEFHLR